MHDFKTKTILQNEVKIHSATGSLTVALNISSNLDVTIFKEKT